MDVVQYQECVGYLRDHKYPKRVHDSDKIGEKNLKKGIRQMCKKFQLDGEEKLMHCKFDPKSNDLGLRAVPNRENYLTILKSLHENKAGGGHCGINATFNKLTERYWWPRMSIDVESFCKNCNICQHQNSIKKGPSELHPIPIVFLECGE